MKVTVKESETGFKPYRVTLEVSDLDMEFSLYGAIQEAVHHFNRMNPPSCETLQHKKKLEALLHIKNAMFNFKNP